AQAASVAHDERRVAARLVEEDIAAERRIELDAGVRARDGFRDAVAHVAKRHLVAAHAAERVRERSTAADRDHAASERVLAANALAFHDHESKLRRIGSRAALRRRAAVVAAL